MDKIIHKTVQLQCDPHKAFEKFTVNHQLESWLCRVAEVEPEVGGKYELFWVPEDRENDSTIGCRVTAIKPNQFLSFEWRSPKQYKEFANSADPLTHVVVFFIPSSVGTDLHVIHSGWRSTAEWEEARQWQDRAWHTVLEALANKI
ncbi:SRPBCC domain-containing protein [bacterium]|nr:SRPBCC domain-containing protein [bacterium]